VGGLFKFETFGWLRLPRFNPNDFSNLNFRSSPRFCPKSQRESPTLKTYQDGNHDGLRRIVLSILNQTDVVSAVRVLLKDLGDELPAAKKKVRNKVIDPLNVLLDLKNLGEDSDWEERLAVDQLYRMRSMKLGDFHQKLLSLHPDWEELPRSKGNPDLVNHKRKLIIELKARRNTVKASDLYQTYDNLLDWTNRGYDGYRAAFTYILPEKRTHLDEPIHFTPSVAKTKTKKAADDRVLEIDGRILWAITVSPRPGIPKSPYENPNAIFEVYEQVTEAVASMSQGLLTKAASKTILKIARDSFHA